MPLNDGKLSLYLMKNGERAFFYGNMIPTARATCDASSLSDRNVDSRGPTMNVSSFADYLLYLVGDACRPRGYNYYGTGGPLTFNQNIVPKYYPAWSEVVHDLDATAQTCIIHILPNPPFTQAVPKLKLFHSSWLYIYLLHTELSEWLATPCILVDSLLVAW